MYKAITRPQLACLLHTLPHRRKMQLGGGGGKYFFKVLNGYETIDFKIKVYRIRSHVFQDSQ